MDTTLDSLIDFIQNNPPEEPPEERPTTWWQSTWEQQLTGALPAWEDIAREAWRDPKEWQRLEAARPRRDYSFLCGVLVGCIGTKLATKWLHSSNCDQRWFVDHMSPDCWILENVHLWSEFDTDMKDAALVRTFQLFRGEPFRTLEKLSLSRQRDLPFSSWSCGYVPSPEIERLHGIIRSARDDAYLERIDEMISRRERACANTTMRSQGSVPYSPDKDERELIARLMDIARSNGYLSAPLPQIVVSFETPPIFVSYPDLEREGGAGDRGDAEDTADAEGRIPRNRERGRPETFSIEELLGVYQPSHERIVIYERGIRWSGNRCDQDWLFAVVLVHEIGHWITHVLPKPGTPVWPTRLYALGEMDVHEGWAQLMTWWIADQIGGKFRDTFEEMNRRQSPPYRVFEQFKTQPVHKVMASLEKLRSLSRPVRLQDWKRALEP